MLLVELTWAPNILTPIPVPPKTTKTIFVFTQGFESKMVGDREISSI